MQDLSKYFANRDIEVYYNTLGATEELRDSYIYQFQKAVDTSPQKKSHHIKYNCYSKLYNLEPRKKLTGFEKISKLDQLFRQEISCYMVTSQFPESNVQEKNWYNTAPKSYKHVLKQFLSKFTNPLLYLSGGLDSELVATAMLDGAVPFTAVIYEWQNNLGEIINLEELIYAYKFCKMNSIVPIIKTINLEKLWATDEFKKLAIELQITSPQIVTHAYIVNQISSEYPGRVHLFGGEVRFSADYLLDDGKFANLVNLIKLNPGWSALSVQSIVQLAGSTNTAQVNIVFNSDGTASTNATGTVSNATTFYNNIPLSGTWTNTPASAYEYRISATGLYISTGAPGYAITSYTPNTIPGFSPYPVPPNSYVTGTVPSAWTPITGATTIWSVWASGQVSGLLGLYEVGANPTIQVRSIANPATVLNMNFATYAKTQPN